MGVIIDGRIDKMGRYVNKGNDGFASVRNSNFVDKSMLIEQVNSVMMTENRWDALCREGDSDLMDEYVDFLRRLFKGSKTEYVFACAYMTGILPIHSYF